MKKVYLNITQLIGNTPLVEVVGYQNALRLDARIIAKLEYFNPAGSVKDRIALAMITKQKNKAKLTNKQLLLNPQVATPALAWRLLRLQRDTGWFWPCLKPWVWKGESYWKHMEPNLF